MAEQDWTKARLHKLDKPKLDWIRQFHPREVSEAGMLRTLFEDEIRRIRKRQPLTDEQLDQLRRMGL